MPPKDEPGIGLAAAIEQVRTELETAASAGSKSSIAFVPESVEMDFEVVFQRTAGADAGVRVWVVSLGAKGSTSQQETQRLRLKLSPVDPKTGEKPRISSTGRH